MSGPGVVGTVEPMSDVDDLYDLRDNVDGLRSRLDRAGVAADPGPLRAHDESGAVSVETDAKGVLRSVTIAMDWSAKVAPQALGAAVLDAVAALATQRLEEVGRALEESFDGPAPARTPLPAQYQTVAGHLEERLGEGRSQEEIDAVGMALIATLQDFIDSVDEVSSDLGAMRGREVTGQSDIDRNVVATMDAAGNLVDLALHPVWLERAHPNNISRLIVVAIDDARRNLGATLPQVVADSRMTRLAGELNDPDALAARLGL